MPFLPAILLLLLDAYAVYCLWQERGSVRRTAFWLVLILLLQPIGALIYLFIFRRPPGQGTSAGDKQG